MKLNADIASNEIVKMDKRVTRLDRSVYILGFIVFSLAILLGIFF